MSAKSRGLFKALKRAEAERRERELEQWDAKKHRIVNDLMSLVEMLRNDPTFRSNADVICGVAQFSDMLKSDDVTYDDFWGNCYREPKKPGSGRRPGSGRIDRYEAAVLVWEEKCASPEKSYEDIYDAVAKKLCCEAETVRKAREEYKTYVEVTESYADEDFDLDRWVNAWLDVLEKESLEEIVKG